MKKNNIILNIIIVIIMGIIKRWDGQGSSNLIIKITNEDLMLIYDLLLNSSKTQK